MSCFNALSMPKDAPSEKHQQAWKKTNGHRQSEGCHQTIPQGRHYRELFDQILEEGDVLQ